MSKTCIKCEIEKPFSEYYKHPQMVGGCLNKCKECAKLDSKNNRNKNVEYYREYDRARGNRHSDDYIKEFRAKYPKKYKAHNMINNAIRDGRMKKVESCETCTSTLSIHAHHDDYDFPLTVRWLCAACHKQWHEANGEGLNAK